MSILTIGSSLVGSIIILVVRSLIIRVNKNKKRFLYLDLKVNNSNKVEEYKKIYTSKINRITLAFIAIFSISLFVDSDLTIFINILFLATYFVYLFLINSRTIKFIENKYPQFFKEHDKIGFGGIFNRRLYSSK